MNGRGSGTRDEQIAAQYVGAQFRRLGFEPGGTGGSYVQTVKVERRTLTAPPVLVVGDPAAPKARWTHGREMLVLVVGQETVAGPLQRIDFSAGPAPAVTPGALVLMLNAPAPDTANELFKQGAAGILSPETPRTPARMDNPRLPALRATIVGVASQQASRPTVVTVSTDAVAVLKDLPEGTRIALELTASEPQSSETCNAVGILRGSDPSGDAILITSHLDHLGRRETATGPDKIFNGADDDASGTVAVIEVAQALARRGTPKRTIIFASFGSEEAGGFGATYLRENPPVPLEKIVANVEFEMIGRPDPKVPPHTLWLTGYERSDLGAALAAHGARLVADPHLDQNFFRRSDNYTLALRGVVAHTVSSYNLHPQYHTPADETRLVDYAHMTEAIGSMVAPLAWLANSDFRPQWKAGMKP